MFQFQFYKNSIKQVCFPLHMIFSIIKKKSGLYNNRIIEYKNIIILLGELYTFLFIKFKKEPSHSPFVLDCL